MSAPALRRLAALFYDVLLLGSVVFAAAGAAVAFVGDAVEPGNVAFRTYLLAVMLAYFTGFWTRAGAPGMRPWRLRIERQDGQALRWRDALLRFACGWVSLLPAGLGFFWAFLDRERLMWHDRWSGTRIVRDESLFR